ncbi:YadA-like family protein [Paraburkholderia sediminicola]|uniref:YadA-like family protein n=1 Tax=Paraburkholderia sediminicola TaxID=458836 RepID=UPI0038B82B09
MNTTYRVIWSAVTSTWNAVSELAKGRRKGVSRRPLAILIASGAAAASFGMAGVAHADTSATTIDGDAVNTARLDDEQAPGTVARSLTTLSASISDTAPYFKVNGKNDGTDDAIASGDGAIAIGTSANAKFANGVAIGSGAGALYPNAVAVGSNAAASQEGVAVGHGAKAENVNSIAVGSGAQANLHSVAIGAGSVAISSATAVGEGALAGNTNTLALGAGAQVMGVNSVALGANSGTARANVVTVGAPGAERQIVNVADGTNDTDAVNVRQLKLAGLVGDDGATLDALVYDASSNRTSVTLGGIGAASAVALTNVAAGRIAADSTDAVNGSQLFQLSSRVDALEGVPGNIGPSPGAEDNQQIAPGRLDAGGQTVTNVAAGIADTDAANVGQVNSAVASGVQQANAYTDSRINGLRSDLDGYRKDANAGSASAMAMANLPQAVLAGEKVVSIAGGTFGGQSAMAVGLSTATQKWMVKGSVTTNTRGSVGAGAGVGYRW